MADESQLSIDTGDSGSFTLRRSLRKLCRLERELHLQHFHVRRRQIQLARSWMDYDQDLTLLQTWYKLDKNTIPAVYRLLTVRLAHITLTTSVGMGIVRKLGRKAWRSSCVKLWNVLWRSGPEAIGEEATCHLLKTGLVKSQSPNVYVLVLDWEVEQGLGGKQPPEEYSHCYKRIITDLLYNLKNEYAPQFIDLHKGRSEINQTLHQAQQRFIRNIHLKLRHTNIHETNVSWGRKGLSAKHNRSHQFYVERLCSHVQRTLTASLNKLMQVRQAKGSFDMQRKEVSRLRVEEEIHRHVRFGKTLAQGYAFRQDFLMEMKHALEASASSQNALLLLGEPGSGKSTILAKLAQLIPSWIPGNAKVLMCFVGLTSDSRNVRLLLQTLCLQLANIYNLKTEMSESLSELSSELCSLLGLVTEDRPLTLLLDGLDNLSEEHEADLSWLSDALLPNVFTVLSASTQSKCARILQSQIKVTVLSLPALNREDVTSGLVSRLASDFRQLTENQWNLLFQSCLSCPSPLYLNLVYAETRKWSSFTPKESLNTPMDPNKLFVSILVSLEREHGPCLVRRTALLVSLSCSGVTEEELLVLLGRDDHVTREMAALHHQTIPVSEYSPVPYAFVARLLHGLKGYVKEGESDGTWVLRWTHAEFTHVALQRYAPTGDSVKAVHADFADYFNGNVPNSQVFQPLAWMRKEKGRRCYEFNLRRLHCLPYHYIHSEQIIPLLTQCLFNYEFLLHKLWGLSIFHVEEDLKAAIIPEKELLDVKVLGQVLCLSHSVLLNDPCQLASQLLGRLERIISQDKPVALGDPRQYTFLHDLMAQCKSSSLPVLVPSYTCLFPPGGLVHTLLSGHMSAVTALAHGRHCIISCSCDGMLNLWLLDEQTRPVRSLPRARGPAVDWASDSLTLCLDDSVLVLQMGHCLQVREVDSGKVLYMEKDSLDVPVVTTACDGRLLVVFYDGSHLVKVFDLVASCSLLRCVNLTLDFEPVHKDQSILVSRHSFKDYVLLAYRDGGEAAIFNAKSGVVSVTLKAQHPAASIQAVEISSQYLLLFCSYPYKRHGEIIHIELFSTASFQYLRSILGCSQDYVSQVTIAGGGSHIVAFCPTPHSTTTEIVIWNLETEDHKHMARFPGLLAHGVCSDLRYCVGFCPGERCLRMWNLASRINDQTLTYNVHKVHSDGTSEIVTMQRYPRYVVCQSTRPGTVRIWNVARTRFKGRPVQVEHGLFSSSDIALVRDLKVYILSDHGAANFTDTPTSVYQTLLVYDLLKKSYVKKQSGLFIVPCPRQDYRLLDGEILLGLSETRDHLILWDLDSGYIKGRIKTSYKETLLSSMDRDSQIMSSKEKTGLVMPWDRRTETQTAKRRRQDREVKREKDEQQRLDREKFNSIDQYLLSGDEQVVICSYFAHHLNVFSVVSEEHLHTLEDRWSHLSLRTAAITHSGGYLVVSNYSEAQHAPYLTVWDTQQGKVRKRLKNEPGICCIAISDDACRVVFALQDSTS
ncbi:NACHT domain- and WD repeat-containing protein 1 [Puntigrus tetrazona]|uniref:NACHT domain- and WD repeat-containing protein 1 n=1 Tax=Puntigrus tetrazona TaxID=1606681 RepID=UPI001C89F13C|nr:NACHT domain- and WD repeat-containing protein 1 [Puntigrus tetrazona]